MQRVAIVGAAGRMGRRLVSLTIQSSELSLSGAVEASGHPALGQDAGVLAGESAQGVLISEDLAGVLAQSDVIIDFSSREAALSNLRAAVAAGVGVVLGTTGLSEAEKAEIQALGLQGGKIVFAPNMSVGVNVLFVLAAQVARTLGMDYDIEVVEMHHNQKKDAPSGTAERLGEILAEARGLNYAEDTRHGRQGMVGARTSHEIGMHSLRGGDVVGDHTVIFATAGERLELTHKASSRDTFAKGAVRAAAWLANVPAGFYDMKAVLGLDG